eukprot:3599543-Rhodomonas_salina.1
MGGSALAGQCVASKEGGPYLVVDCAANTIATCFDSACTQCTAPRAHCVHCSKSKERNATVACVWFRCGFSLIDTRTVHALRVSLSLSRHCFLSL